MKELFLSIFQKVREQELRYSYWEETIAKGNKTIYQIKISDSFTKVIYTKEGENKDELYQLVLNDLLLGGLKNTEENYLLKVMQEENKKLREELLKAQTIQFKMTKEKTL